MGTQLNGNPYYYRSLTIYNPATSILAQAEVMDKCEGCNGHSINLTPALFSTLTNNDLGLGRVHGVNWIEGEALPTLIVGSFAKGGVGRLGLQRIA
jgi:hypothetical protein